MIAVTIIPIAQRIVGAGFFALCLLIGGQAQALDGPSFRKGMWHFERQLDRLENPHSRSSMFREEMTRCVDPTIAMRETFHSPDVGRCHSAKPKLIGNRYVFALRCDFMGPVRTEITVESESAYTEVNALTVGSMPRQETVTARRVGDCPASK